MEYFWCGSFQSFFMALSLKDSGKNITVISPNSSVIETCKLMKVPFLSINLFSVNDLIINFFKIKKNINNIQSSLEKTKLYFSHTQYDVFCFLFVKSYLQRGEVVFFNFELEYEAVKKIVLKLSYLKIFIKRQLINLLYRINIIIKRNGDFYILSINDAFIKKNNIEVVNNKSDFFNIISNVVLNNQIKINNSDILFLYDDYQYVITEDSLERLYLHLNNYKISIKRHPLCKDVNPILSAKYQFPSYIPVEFLIGNINRTVLSICSAALIPATKFSNLKIVSLLNLVDWNQEDYKNTIREYLIKSSNNMIFFPSEFSELEKFL